MRKVLIVLFALFLTGCGSKNIEMKEPIVNDVVTYNKGEDKLEIEEVEIDEFVPSEGIAYGQVLDVETFNLLVQNVQNWRKDEINENGSVIITEEDFADIEKMLGVLCESTESHPFTKGGHHYAYYIVDDKSEFYEENRPLITALYRLKVIIDYSYDYESWFYTSRLDYVGPIEAETPFFDGQGDLTEWMMDHFWTDAREN